MAATFEQAKDQVAGLVAHFRANSDRYLSPAYKETWARQEFIDPLFIALGWDVRNERRVAPQYREVITEESLDVEGHRKAPDYVFRVGQTNKFFAEAKKPGVAIKSDPAPAYQLRRYAWSAKLPFSILTDFHELAVYDCRSRPRDTDKASISRIHYIGCEEYPDRFRDVWDLFSRDAVWAGSFDRIAQEKKGKRGTGEVDAEFLKEIEGWRDVLARNIALRNPRLSIDELNDSVQRTIDRIIFLRMAEDRGIEPYEQLRQLAQGDDVYRHLMRDLCRKCDERYNSGLFDFEKDKVTPRLAIDDKVLKPIIAGLYFPQSPYEFSVMPPEILGNVYEQFLGKVIRLTAGHQAKVEEKPEVKKAGGVYYTPAYIVEYIVKNTVGKMTEGKSPKELEGFRVLDMACGSGSFLLGAYRHLLDWHLDWYVAHDPESWARKKTPPIWRHPTPHTPSPIPDTPAWRLTVAEKKRILLAHVFGVDIDRQAVEVTKLSLLLKVLEGESDETLGEQRQLTLWQDRALPDLDNNIKCGNSLIGPDYFTDRLIPDRDEMRRINAFDWKSAFPDAMKAGGFDCVIGNPPYGASFSDEELVYLLEHYPEARKFPDSYCLFMVQGSRIVREMGEISFIVPNTFCDLENCEFFRKWLLSSFALESIWQTGWAFKAAVVDTLVFGFAAQKPRKTDVVEITVDGKRYTRTRESFLSNELSKIDYRNFGDVTDFVRKIFSCSDPLGDLATVKAGVKMYEKGKGSPPQTDRTLNERPYSVRGKRPKGWLPLYRGTDVGRYRLAPAGEFVNYGPWLAAPRSQELFHSPKILMRRTDYRCMAVVESENAIAVNSCHVIKLKDRIPPDLSSLYVLGLLNSALIQKVFEMQNPQMVGKVFAEIKVIYVERLPIRTINFSDPSDKARHDRMVSLVEQMLELHKRLHGAKTAADRELYQRQIDATDREIDRLVYDLYGLTEEEIRIVEGG